MTIKEETKKMNELLAFVQKKAGTKLKLVMKPFTLKDQILYPEVAWAGNMAWSEQKQNEIRFGPGTIDVLGDSVLGPIAHELGHAVLKPSHKNCDLPCERQAESDADKWAVMHGFGKEVEESQKILQDLFPSDDEHYPSMEKRFSDIQTWIREYNQQHANTSL